MSSSSSPAADAGCPACGLALPAYARFCARCGTPQPHPVGDPPRTGAPAGARRPVWLIVTLAGGAGLALLVAAVYAAIAADPRLPAGTPTGLDPKTIRISSLLIAVVAAGFSGLQVVAVVGLARRRSWGKPAATLACVVWALTCVGLPVALLGLNALWRGPSRPRD